MASPSVVYPQRRAFPHAPGRWLMGGHLVSEVLVRWTHVSDRAFRVLVRMALTALDAPSKGRPAAVYHGGRELLAMSLRSDKGTPDTRYRAVKRAVAELTAAGAIEHLATGWAGQNAVYRLTLDRAEAKSPSPGMGGQSGPPEGGLISPPMGGPSGTEWGASKAPPRNQEEPQEELSEEIGLDLRTASHPPREAEPVKSSSVVSIFRRTDQAQATLAEATARVAKRKADYQARIASGEAT